MDGAGQDLDSRTLDAPAPVHTNTVGEHSALNAQRDQSNGSSQADAAQAIKSTSDKGVYKSGVEVAPTKQGFPSYLKGRALSLLDRNHSSGWLTWKLRLPFLCGLLVFQLGAITAIAVLLRLSEEHDGFIEVALPLTVDNTSVSLSILWSGSLLWTAIPSLIFSGYKMAWDSILEALKLRQPFVELRRAHGSSAKKTIMLDYRGSSSFIVWARMFANGHHLLACSTLLSLAISLVVVPFSSHLLTSSPIISNRTVLVHTVSSLNEGLIEFTTDLRPMTEVVAASLVQGGKFPAWSTPHYAFPGLSFDTTGDSQTSGTLANYTGGVVAWSASLDCRIIDRQQSGAILNLDTFTASFNFSDRGCQVTNPFLLVSENQNVSINGWSSDECGPGSQLNDTRVCIFSDVYEGPGQHSDVPPTNVTLLSCIPHYTRTYGTLTVQPSPQDGFADPTILSFTPDPSNTSAIDDQESWDTLQKLLFSNAVDDANKNFVGSDFAALIYDYSSTYLNGSSPLDSNALLNATETIFAAFFSALFSRTCRSEPNATRADPPLPDGATATQTIFTQRLFVVTPIAAVVMAAMALSAACVMVVAWYSHAHPSSMRAEPKGLLSYAEILEDSDAFGLLEYAREKRNTEPKGSSAIAGRRIHRYLKKTALLEKDSKWSGNWTVKADGEQGEDRLLHLQIKKSEPNQVDRENK